MAQEYISFSGYRNYYERCLLRKSLIMLYYDNKAVFEIVNNLIQHERIKYNEINCHFIKKKITSRQIYISFIYSASRAANILIKGLSISFFLSLVNKMDL